jgi:pyruvate dehydrogenase E1 component beta subunit
MSGGQFAVPVVIRMATGGGRQLAAQHSHSLEGWYAHIPGLKVLAPGTVDDARHMLAAALADPNPVLIFEHVVLYNAEGELDTTLTGVDIEHAKVRRPGSDVSLVTYGNGLPKCLTAAETLASEGINAEVIDLRVLRPLDTATIVESLSRTHRCVIVDEAWPKRRCTNWMRRCAVSAAGRFPCLTPHTWKRPRCRRWPTSSPPRVVW